MKYNLGYKHKSWIPTPALEAETEVTQLPIAEQDYVRFRVAHNIKLLYKQYNGNQDQNTKHMKSERDILNNIQDKLMANNATVSKSDKGNSIVITYLEEYHNKILEFISDNNFSTATNELTNKFQRKLRNTINECQLTIPTDDKWKYINLNPSAPIIRGLPKIHKINSPIRPVINWRNAPAYKLVKLLSKLLQVHILLPYTFNVKNSVHLMNDLLEIPVNPKLQHSFNITNMYSKVPTNELIEIIDSMCSKQGISDKLKKSQNS